MRQIINGILLLDKPAGFTSNQVLQKVKHLFNAKKAGHTGSLDPIATGMLPICFGEATKFSQFLLEADKKYQVTVKLGIKTTTGDREGELIATKPVQGVTPERIKNIMQTLIGKTTQIPPMYSALKHQGKPLYELARAGIEIERKPREIHLYSMTLTAFRASEFEFSVHCSKGTYVRTLVEDIGRELGCGAHVSELRREVVTPYENYPMYTMDNLNMIANANDHVKLTTCLLPMSSAVKALPSITLSTASIYYLQQGQTVQFSHAFTTPFVQLLSENSNFIGIGEVIENGRIKPHRLVSLEKY